MWINPPAPDWDNMCGKIARVRGLYSTPKRAQAEISTAADQSAKANITQFLARIAAVPRILL